MRIEYPLSRSRNSLVKRLHNAEYRHDDIHGTVTLVPKLLELYHGILNVALGACADHALHDDGVWLVAHFEDVVARDEAKPGPRRLKIIDCLSHVALRGKYKCRQAIVIVFDLESSKVETSRGYGVRRKLTFSSAQISNNR